jgi:hypothetical protein
LGVTVSWRFFPDDETHAANGMKKFHFERLIHFSSQTRDVHVDYIIERRVSRILLPYIASQHFP